MIYIAKKRVLIFAFVIFTAMMHNHSNSQHDPCFYDVTDIQIATYNENSIFVHPVYPSKLINANNSDGISIYYSTNSGLNWIECDALTSGGPDPSVAIDLYGRYYAAHLSGAFQGVRLHYLDIIDDCEDWDEVMVFPTSTGADQPYIWVDNSTTSNFEGRLYCSTGGGNSQESEIDYIFLKYSTDQGANWSETKQISYDNEIWLSGSVIRTDADGNVYITWRISAGFVNEYIWDKIGFKKSTDGGNTWFNNSDEMPYSIIGSSSNEPGHGGGQSAMAINQQTDELFIMWSSQDDEYSPYQIYFIKSTDGGDTWSGSQIPIDQNTEVNNTYPSLACDPETGTLACVYYSETETNIYDTYLAISTNSGDNWCYLPISDAPSDGHPGGDYLAIAMSEGMIYPVWGATLTSPIDISYYAFDFNSIINSNVQKRRIERSNFIDKSKIIPNEFKLHQNYPNPFNSSTLIKYDLRNYSYVSLIIYDLLGKEVRRLVNKHQNAGFWNVIWDGSDNYGLPVSSGIYVYKIFTGNLIDSKKLVIIK